MGGGPFYRGEQFRHPDAAIPIRVNQRQGFFIKLETLYGTAQRDPDFLIEVLQVDEIGPGVEGDLIDPASAEESPNMG